MIEAVSSGHRGHTRIAPRPPDPGVCRCASEDLTTYYTADYDDPEGDCDFFCDDGVYEAQ